MHAIYTPTISWHDGVAVHKTTGCTESHATSVLVQFVTVGGFGLSQVQAVE